MSVTITHVGLLRGRRGTNYSDVEIAGTGFADEPAVEIGTAADGVSAQLDERVNSELLIVTIEIAATAALGEYDITVCNPATVDESGNRVPAECETYADKFEVKE